VRGRGKVCGGLIQSERSRGIYDLRRLQDALAPEGVAAALDAALAHKVHFTPEDLLQLVLHMHKVEEAVPGRWVELDEHVHVALRREVFPQDGAEQGKLDDVPLAAEVVYLIDGQFFFSHGNPLRFLSYSYTSIKSELCQIICYAGAGVQARVHMRLRSYNAIQICFAVIF
jgi:hypothetical protein